MSYVLWGLFCLFCGIGLLSQLSAKIETVRSKWRGLFTGIGVTALVQSSSAVSCSVCMMAKNGLPFYSCASLLIGANIGSAATPFLTALGLRIHTSMLFAATGICLFFLPPPYQKLKTFGCGFCLILLGASLSAEGADSLISRLPSPQMLFCRPLVSFVCGILLTALLQSSAVTMMLLQVVLLRIPLSLADVLPFLLGQNIGTTSTAWLFLLSQKDKAAERSAAFHTLFNVFGALWALPLWLVFRSFFSVLSATPLSTAAANLLFNTVNAALILPFVPTSYKK